MHACIAENLLIETKMHHRNTKAWRKQIMQLTEHGATTGNVILIQCSNKMAKNS